MTTTRQIPATQNDAWGFWGTMGEQADSAWPLAMVAVSDATGQPGIPRGLPYLTGFVIHCEIAEEALAA